jgi:hypothetical protein
MQEEPDHSAMDHSQMDHSAMQSGEEGDHSAHGMDMAGEGSGTSRLPPNEITNHRATIGLGGDDTLMLHGFVWPVYTNQSGPRGDDKLYVQSMAMATMTAPFEGGKFSLRTMMSLEPLMRHDGYPTLFATGEVAYGEPLVDRQHPHDLFMELAGRLDLDIAEGTTAFLYGGPVGEPALGPSAFMHRASARYNPECRFCRAGWAHTSWSWSRTCWVGWLVRRWLRCPTQCCGNSPVRKPGRSLERSR